MANKITQQDTQLTVDEEAMLDEPEDYNNYEIEEPEYLVDIKRISLYPQPYFGNHLGFLGSPNGILAAFMGGGTGMMGGGFGGFSGIGF